VAKEAAGHRGAKTLDVYVNTLSKAIKAAKSVKLPPMEVAE
jgi:hypothetical protein